ncbi:OapA family protein [Marinobacter salicampi]|uniref:OapA family protein n=1 Tax=Marinobacter salicampi TaxID=435907 RepID=UPI0014099E97|nr:peptidoglycan DD-metalloendopeptidase family protein [Marinobacter salicampi]
MLKTFPKTHLAAAFLTGTVIAVSAVFSPSSDVEANRLVVALDLDSGEITKTTKEGNRTLSDDALSAAAIISTQDSSSSEQSAPVATSQPVSNDAPVEPAVLTDSTSSESVEPRLSWTEFNIKNGDSLSTLFKKAGFSDRLMLSVIHGKGNADKLQRLYAGESIAFATDGEGELAAIRLQRSRMESLEIERTDSGFVGEQVVRQPEIRTTFAEAEITSSLFGAGQAAGLTDKLTMELAGIFGWDIDFVLDIRKGDRFSVVYEELFLDGEKIDNGRILAANFNNRSRELAAVLYTDEKGSSDYYTPDGRSMRKAFLRTPVDFARISSNFNLNRRHPVLNTLRAHKGTDYAARTGTPIKAAGDGKVILAGRKGGYGKTVVLQHGSSITTLYAHMNSYAKGVRSGTYVKQGQVIGYVGATGLATGPHLHYEFRVNGTHRNPVTVKLPDAAPIPKAKLAHFRSATDQTLAQLDTYRDRRLTLARGD